MKLNRTEAREKIMIILYQIDLYVKDNIPYDLENVFHENLEMDNKFVRDVVNGVLENRENIDKVIIIGEDELKQNSVTLKDMITGNQELVKIDDLVKTLKEM